MLFGAAMLLVMWVPVNVAMLVLTGQSGLSQTYGWVTFKAGSIGDSWDVMKEALDWIRSHPDGGLYQAIFFEGSSKFQYAPTSLLPMAGLEALGIAPTAAFLNRVNWVFIAVTALAVSGLTDILLRRSGGAMSGPMRLAAAVLAGGAVLAFYPVMMGYYLGQLQTWINMLFALACLAWALERRGAAGVAIGLICLLKPQFGLFLLWGLLRREWRFVIPLCAVGAGGLLVSVLLFGFRNHLEYLSVLGFLSRHGEAYWANQSMNGLLHRLVGNGTTEWDANGFPPFTPLVYSGSMIATLVIVALALSVRRGEGALASLFDSCWRHWPSQRPRRLRGSITTASRRRCLRHCSRWR